ncbi:MAG TPA: RHS repeat domain-containing protein, partial [Vicinamibacterales bacterium]|nr:RHS repeat domain-containing protein [Vicinamibacterales bacterium]
MRRALLAIVVLFSLSVHAQKSDQGSPALERGLHADKLYQFNDFDNVSLFNGNLGIDVPIGPSYPVRGGLTYQLTLYYNSKFWDFDRSPTWSHAYPARSSNAGVGWTIGMGQYLGNETYQSPDGGEHPFNRPLEGYPKFTTDGTYLRLRNLSTDSQGIVEIDFPNGVVQHHERNADASWSLTEIRAPRGIGKVTMSVVAPGPCGTDQNFVHAWHIEDTEGRHTYVCFKTYTLDDVARPLASRVVFPAPPGQSPLQYDFTFETISDIPRVSGEYDPGDPEHEQWRMTHSVQFLKSLQSPDGSSWQFDHRLNEPRIETLVLPTKARIEYLYGLVPVTNEGQSGRCPGPYPEGVPPGGGMTDGVVKRTVIPVVAGGTLPPFVWTYDRILSGQQSHKPETCSDPLTMWDEMIVTVKDPLGGRVDSHFTMWQDSFTPSENGFKGEHYSLPWGKYDPDQDRYLSQEQYQCIGSDCTTKLTSTYVRHDIVPGSFTDTTLNRYPEHRLASQAVYDHQRVVHADSADNVVIDDDEHPCVSEGSGTRCPFTSTEWTEWDSFSHYRVVKSAYDFGGTEKGTRTVTTNWNAGRTINTGDPWVLDVFDEKTTEETGKDKIVEQACIQPGLGGFVRGTRLLAGPQSANDLITRLELDADMNPRAEKYYGGDATPLPQPAAQAPTACAALDALENVTPAFETANTWSKGVMTTSQYAGATFLGLDLDIDAAGIVTHSRDTAGAQTDYHYDAAGRIQSIEPPDGAEITYGYGNASAAFDGTVWRLTTPATA